MLHLRDLAENPSLIAHEGEIVLLDPQPPGPDEPRIPYELRAGTHEFCLEDPQSYFKGLILADALGQEVLRKDANAKCGKADLAGGIYTLRIFTVEHGYSQLRAPGNRECRWPESTFNGHNRRCSGCGPPDGSRS